MLIVVSGPSGVGKSTVVRRLCETPGFVRAVTATTRPPRLAEVEGKDYYFLTRQAFEKGVEEEAFLEHATIFGNLYGTPKKPIEEAVAAGKHVVADIDTQGAASVRRLGLAALFVFLRPPDSAELRRRLEGRRSESPETLARRLAAAEAELAHADRYDVIVVNRSVDQAVEEIRGELTKRGLL